MDVLRRLKNTYVKERRTTARLHLTLRGFFLRLFNAENYWDELTARERQLLEFGARTLADLLVLHDKNTDELKNYQLILKNLNAKLTERGNYLLVIVTLITALGMTKANDLLSFTSMSWDGLTLFSIAIVTVFLALNDTIRVRNRATVHEELINVIERHLSYTANKPLAPVELTPSSSSIYATDKQMTLQ